MLVHLSLEEPVAVAQPEAKAPHTLCPAPPSTLQALPVAMSNITALVRQLRHSSEVQRARAAANLERLTG